MRREIVILMVLLSIFLAIGCTSKGKTVLTTHICLEATYKKRNCYGCWPYAAFFQISFYPGFSWEMRALFCTCLSDSLF